MCLFAVCFHFYFVFEWSYRCLNDMRQMKCADLFIFFSVLFPLFVFVLLSVLLFHSIHSWNYDCTRQNAFIINSTNELGLVDLSKYACDGKGKPRYVHIKCFRRVDVHFINNCAKLLWQLKSSTSEQIGKHFFCVVSPFRSVPPKEMVRHFVKTLYVLFRFSLHKNQSTWNERLCLMKMK